MNFINVEGVSVVIFFIGLYGLISQKEIMKSIISIGIMETAVILFFITINNAHENIPPVGDKNLEVFADPVPQALMITAIVIGIGVTAVALTMFIHFNKKYGSRCWQDQPRKG